MRGKCSKEEEFGMFSHVDRVQIRDYQVQN